MEIIIVKFIRKEKKKKIFLLGLTGHVQIDENGDRIPSFNLDNVHNGKNCKSRIF